MQSSCIFAGFLLLIVACSFVSGQPDGFRPLSGFGNNRNNPTWGVANTPYVREVDEVSYSDGQSEVSTSLPSAREISNLLFGIRERDARDTSLLSDWHMAYGQFIAHDITLNAKKNDAIALEGEVGGEALPIAVPQGDRHFDPFGTGTQVINFTRSTAFPSEEPRIPINRVTHYLDASLVYSSSEERLEKLRNQTHRHLLAESLGFFDEHLLPLVRDVGVVMDNNARRVPTDSLFAAGDIRANDNILLAACHTLWSREHNRIAHGLLGLYPRADPEDIFWQARRRTIAYHQAVTFNEYVATTIGEPLPEYTGYKNVDPRIMIEFATAAFRYGHSETNTAVNLATEERTIFETILLRDAYFNPEPISTHGIEPVIIGASMQRQQRVDTIYVDDVRNMLFGPPGAGGSDLASLTIQRARDHGLANYNDVRRAFGLRPANTFDDVTQDAELALLLKSAYGTPRDCETFVCGLAEDHVGSSNVGPLFAAIIKEQYMRMRDADRFYYKNKGNGFFDDEDIAEIDPTTIADIVLRNTKIEAFPCSGFFASTTPDCLTPIVSPQENEFTLFTSQAELLNGKIILSWEIVGDIINFAMEVDSNGWAGIGLSSSSGNMIDSDAMIAFSNGDSGFVEDYYITDRQVGCPGVCLDSERGGENSILESTGFDSGGKSFFTWSRLLDTGDGEDRAITNSDSDVIVASSSSRSLNYHGSNKAAAKINFFTGSVALVDTLGKEGPEWDRLTVHGVLMFVAWTVLFPLGIIVVRFCKKLLVRWWFRLHMLIQYLAVLIIIVALILAVEAVASLGFEHLRNAHAILGIVSVSLSILTPAVGQITSVMWNSARKGVPIFPDRVHFILGYLSPIVACVTIFFGLDERCSRWYWYLLAAIWIAIITIGFWTAYFIHLTWVTVEKHNNKKLAKEEPQGTVESAEEHWSSGEED